MKIFKNLKWLLSISLAGMTMVSCDSFLDVEVESQILDKDFWKNEADASAGVAATYDAMQSAYSRKYFLWGEMRSDNFDAAPATENPESLEMTSNNLSDQTQSYSRWDDLYRMALNANLAINNIPNITGNVNNLLGEAHALRAFVYFDMVRVYGAVPLYLDIIDGPNDNTTRPKTAGSIIMDSVVIPDMLRAEELITTPHEKARFSLASVYCLQAEVYMHRHEYALAKEALDKLEDLGEFSLANTPTEFHALFRSEPIQSGLSPNEQETGPELIFSLVFSDVEDLGDGDIYALFWPGVPSYVISDELETKWLEKYPTDSVEWVAKYPDFVPPYRYEDGRLAFGDVSRYLQMAELNKDIGEKRYGKYNTSNYPGSQDAVDIPIYRYGGMLLLKAEAELQLGNFQEAVNLINRIRLARALPRAKLSDFQTKEQLLDAVLEERQFELLGEGKRWWDLVRNDMVVDVMGPINGQTSETILFPIYFEHLVENPELTQTRGYK